MRRCNGNIHVSCDSIAMAYLLWLSVCFIHSEGMNVGIMTGLETMILVCAFILARSIPRKEWILLGLSIAGTLQSIYVIFQQCGIAESGHEIFSKM